MAQILKDECREKIIKAAKEEFLKKGYKGASLRRIADKAGMTVGNLYRYYNNKEDLNKQIVVSTLDKIEDTLNSLTDNKISIETRVFDAKMNKYELIEALDSFAIKMCDIYQEASEEFGIVMLHSKLNDKFVNWFFNIAMTLISQNYDPKKGTINIEELANAHANSVWAGVKNIIVKSKLNSDDKKQLIKVYLRTYVMILDSDINAIIDAI